MTSNKTIALCLVMLAIGSAAGAASVRFRLLPGLPAPRCEPAASTPLPCPKQEHQELAQPVVTPSAPPPSAAVPREAQPAAPNTRRVVVCEAATGTPMLRALSLATALPTWAVHCGAQAQLITISGSGANAELQRIASITTRVTNAQLYADAAPVLAADLSGDGKPDLLVPFLYRDAETSPRGGALYALLHDDAGSFGRPQPLSASAVRAFALTQPSGDGEVKNPDLLIVHAEDARLSRASELIVMRGGPSPVRSFVAPLGLDARAIAAVDLDLDGRDDAIVAAQKPAVEALYLDAKAVRERTSFDLANAREVLAADLDGDGHDDAVLAGDALGFVLATAGNRELREIAGSSRMTDVRAVDVNADGRLDLVGYAAPEVVAFVQLASGGFERRTLCRFAELPFFPLSIVSTGTPGPDGIAIVALGRDRTKETRIELATIQCGAGDTPRFAERADALRDAPLRLDLHVP